MRPAAVFLFLLLPGAAQAHALDEYVQHGIVSVERNRIQISLRLVPGILVLPSLLQVIDRDGDKQISDAEARAYGGRVAGDLRLMLDGRLANLALLTVEVPPAAKLKDGFGAIRLHLTANAPNGAGPHRLELSNRHLEKFSAYLVNALQPDDKAIRIGAQQRNPNQSVYRLDYVLER